MAYKLARIAGFLSLFLGLSAGLLTGQAPTTTSPAPRSTPARVTRPQGGRTVFLAGKLADESLITLTAAVAAGAPRGVVLIDSDRASPHNKWFLQAYQPDRVVPVGSFPEGSTALESSLGVKTAPIIPWNKVPPADFWKMLFPEVKRVVVAPAKPRGLLLQAACLAGVAHAPLLVIRDGANQAEDLRRQLQHWQPQTIFAVGTPGKPWGNLPHSRVVRLADEEAVAACYLRQQRETGPIENLVVANPVDNWGEGPTMSSLAPWVALKRRAALLLTEPGGANVNELVGTAVRKPALRHADTLILVAAPEVIPTELRPNPAEGKDSQIEMEPLTPAGSEPFSFATGRLFHEDPNTVFLLLARQQILHESSGPRKALVVSNPSGGLPLLEMFSRSTAQELRNRGYQTTALFGGDVSKDELRQLLPEQDLFLWEGHYSTLVKDYGLPDWTEPLQPGLLFLQSCLALNAAKVQPLLERGSLAVIGTSTRTYSGSGGACALAFFNALLYEDRPVGDALRQAKNFLLAYSLLKEKRLGKDAHLGGANLRSAWAFSLWGDPTMKLPAPLMPDDALPHVCHEVQGNAIVIKLPDATHEKTKTFRYQAEMLPNSRLAGLLTRSTGADDGQRLKPFIFTEVHLPQVPAGKSPWLTSRVPGSHWVFCWDRRRRCGYLLVTPRSKDHEEMRFHVHWRPRTSERMFDVAKGKDRN